MKAVRGSAPGKLMFAGEYSVVDGTAPSLAAAVDARVTVTVTPGGEDWRVTSPSMELHGAPVSDVPVIEAALADCAGLPSGGLMSITTDLPVGAGLGSSAAVCVATLGALRALAGLEPPGVADVVRVHRAAQGGVGSGYDVATSLLGGVVRFDPTGDDVRAERLSWPDGLSYAVLTSGVKASTVDLVGRVAAWREAKGDEAERWVVPMGARARELGRAFAQGVVPAILDAVADAEEALVAMDRAGSIGLMPRAHAELKAAVEDAGAYARTSGAGGGDCLWALSTDPALVEAGVEAARALGFAPLEVALSEEGLTVEILDDDAGQEAAAAGEGA